MKILLASLVAAALVFAAGANAGNPNRFCQAQFTSGGPLYDGSGVTVTAPDGSSLTVCRVSVDPPAGTTVTLFPAGGGVVVMTASGRAVLVFHG
jgi:hypothetical protein